MSAGHAPTRKVTGALICAMCHAGVRVCGSDLGPWYEVLWQGRQRIVSMVRVVEVESNDEDCMEQELPSKRLRTPISMDGERVSKVT